MALAAARVKRALFLVLSAALIFGALVLPNHPGTMKWTALQRWPLELPVILLALFALGWRHGVTHLFAFALTLAVVTKIADFAMFETYNRLFNFVVDFYLLHPAFTLLSASIGQVAAVAVFTLATVAILVLFWLFLTAMRQWARLPLRWPLRLGAGALALAATGWAAADVGHHLEAWKFERSPPGTAWTSRLLFNRGMLMRTTAEDLMAFRTAMADDPYAETDNALNALEGRDVLLIWLESYGRASFDNPLYTDTHLATLKAAEDDIKAAGLAMRSGWFTAPTAGGQSWLSHSTLASGFWIADQARYRALLASGHKWLFHIAQEAGYRTAAVMPAITMPWPESGVMGFDRVLPAAEIPYQGARFRWVTMPDQFTLSVYPELLSSDDPRPFFTQIALISSHAPWTPIADMVPWEAVGDGTVFNEMAARGPTPKALWDDRDDVRDAYRRAVDYVLRVTFSHVARLGAEGGSEAPLVIVAGDHQSAPFVAGSENADVPFHLIGAPELVDRVANWGWAQGLIPAPDGPVRPMDSFRNDFIAAFTTPQNAIGLNQ